MFGALYLKHHLIFQSLLHIPDSLLNLPSNCELYWRNLRENLVTHLDARLLFRRQNGLPYPRISYSIYQQSNSNHIPSYVDIIEDIYKKAEKEYTIPFENLSKESNIRQWIVRLRDSYDYVKTNKDFLKRIIEILERAEKDGDFRSFLETASGQAIGECGDRISLLTITIDIELEIKKLIEKEGTTIEEFAQVMIHGNLIIDNLYTRAQYKIDELKKTSAVDEVEIILAYIMKLKNDLKINTQVDSMRFYDACVKKLLTDKDFEIAKGQVLEDLKDESLIVNFFVNNKSWISFLNKNYEKRLEELNEEYYEKAKKSGYVYVETDNPSYVLTVELYRKSLDKKGISSWIHPDVRRELD